MTYINLTGPKTATVVVPEDQLSLAIGRDGQNARLAAKLTGWRIDIKSLPEATSELLFRLQNNPEYKIFSRQEEDVIPLVESILAKKAGGRPITPEDYHLMSSFVDRVEMGVIQRRQVIKKEYEQRLKAAQDAVPEAVYELPIFALGLSEKMTQTLIDEEYDNVGDLMVQVFFDPSKILEIKGIGEKTLEDIRASFSALTLSLPQPEPEPEVKEVSEIVEVEPVTEAELPKEVDVIVEEVETVPEKPVVEAEFAQETPTEKLVEEEKEELPSSLEDIFKLKPEMLESVDTEDESTETDDEKDIDKKTKKKKKKRFVDVEYDPEKDKTIYRKKHKRGGDILSDWENDWDF